MEEYKITLIPMENGKPVIYQGKDYSTAAVKCNIDINRKKFYLRENGKNSKAREIIEKIIPEMVHSLNPESPLVIQVLIEDNQ